MKKLLFMLLCCSIFVIGCNNVSEEEFDEFDFDEVSDESYGENNTINEDKINELRKLIENQLEENKFDEAKSTIDEVIKMAPGVYDLFCSRGKLKLLTGDLDGAETDVNFAIEHAPDNWMYALLARIKEAKGNKEEAISLYKKSIELGYDDDVTKKNLSELEENK